MWLEATFFEEDLFFQGKVSREVTCSPFSSSPKTCLIMNFSFLKQIQYVTSPLKGWTQDSGLGTLFLTECLRNRPLVAIQQCHPG